jgi:serine/threonine protein kinase
VAADGAGIRFGQYVLLRRLARGGMAEVFLAQQRGLEGFDRRVAVKRILPHLADAPDFIKMFLSEAKLAAQLTHPNIVHIYDFGKVDTDYFIAMELVDGVHAGQLFKHIAHAAPGERLSPTMIARIGADAAAALHYAHELCAPNGQPLGLVHRDVSPANLMVTFDGAVKLCDFGIAKAAALGEKLTLPGHVKGKYAYMSPEQTTGVPLDGRSDVYSLAIVLWELVVGRTIVPRGDAIEAMRAIRDGKLTPIDRAAPWTPPALAAAITRALHTQREQRPTAMQLAQELEAFIKSSPELATPLQLASWLRVRFPREPIVDGGGGGGATTGTQASPGTLGGSSLITTDTSSETRALAVPARLRDALAAEQLANAATVIGGEPPVRDPDSLGLGTGEPAELDASAADTDDPDAPTLHGDDNDVERDNEETVLHSGGFVAPDAPDARDAHAVHDARDAPGAHAAPPPSPPLYDPRHPPAYPPGVPIVTTHASAKTLYDPRARPPVVFPPPAPPGPPVPAISRRALAIAGAIGVAVLAVVIALAARGPSRPPTLARAFVPGDASIDAPVDARPVPDAPPAPPPPPPPPPDAPAPPADAAPTSMLEVRTRPDGATITINGEPHPAPVALALPAGHITIDAALDGWLPEHRELDLAEHTRVDQDIVFTRRARPATGHLSVTAPPGYDVYIGNRRAAKTSVDGLELALEPGNYTLQFRHAQHVTVIRNVTITAGKTAKTTVPP